VLDPEVARQRGQRTGPLCRVASTVSRKTGELGLGLVSVAVRAALVSATMTASAASI
jgi:hypothetical protein